MGIRVLELCHCEIARLITSSKDHNVGGSMADIWGHQHAPRNMCNFLSGCGRSVPSGASYLNHVVSRDSKPTLSGEGPT